jgi:hypothetical protein
MSQPSTPSTPIHGSVKNKIVHPDLAMERSKANFDTQELQTFLMGG